ncbi:MAG: beta-galactosidase [Candidatus Helarchaeota archaeon]|nr:beta-galactosidase [Candidatus Helarchaeota archaeon]
MKTKTQPKQFKINQGFMKTPWTDKVDRNSPLPEYPRPQLRREKWLNLNGFWEYKIQEKDLEAPTEFAGKISVPFCVESYLSGVGRPLYPNERIWYHRKVVVPEEWGNSEVILHFGAVDWEARVYINGSECGTHHGGYLPFSFNITEFLKSGECDLLVSVWDPTDSENHQHGKQTLKPSRIFYTPCSGIWQTVWVEPVPKNGIQSLKITPDIDTNSLQLKIEQYEKSIKNMKIKVTSSAANLDYSTELGEVPITIKLTNPHLWTPDDPFLYDLVVSLARGEEPIDSVSSYFAMRKFSIGKDQLGITRLLLNNKPAFHLGPLDQGYWPDGIYTAPTDDALKFDIEFTKKLGFNMIRKHIKVEPARWYYHCDKLGVIVWQDMISGGKTGLTPKYLLKVILKGYYTSKDTTPKQYKRTGRINPKIRTEFESELKEMIDHLHNIPCIGVWVTFNEGWGQYDSDRITTWLKRYDPSRIVDGTSGFDLTKTGDIRSWHIYIRKLKFFEKASDFSDYAIAISECGGYKLKIPEHVWDEKKAHGYGKAKNKENLTEKYGKLILQEALPLVEKGLNALVYTQLTDVETEVNGLITFDRMIEKVNINPVNEVNLSLIQKMNELTKKID